MKSKLRWVGITILAILVVGGQGFVIGDVKAELSQTDVLVDLFGDAFVSADEVAAAIAQGLVEEISAGPNDADLVFTPVKPCRDHDSRKACSICGVFNPGNSREFYVYGTSDIQSGRQFWRLSRAARRAGGGSHQCDGRTAIGHRVVCRISCQC